MPTKKKPTTKKVARKAPTKKAVTKRAPAKKAATKQPATKKATTKKRATRKKLAQLPLRDPAVRQPLIFKPRVDTSNRDKIREVMVQNVRHTIDTISERSKKKPVCLLTPQQLRMHIIPYEDIQFQHMLGAIGFRFPGAIEIVAQEKTGSTTFVFDWIGRLLDMGCYSGYCFCETKKTKPERIARLLDSDPVKAEEKLGAVLFVHAETLDQLDHAIETTVRDLRKKCDASPVTKGNPIFFFIDPWSALMSKAEAKGRTDWGKSEEDKKKTEAAKETSAGNTFGHAVHAHGLARWAGSLMREYNCCIVFVNKQNDKVDMNARPVPAHMQPGPSKNDTRRGGRAMRWLCSYRITMVKTQELREGTGRVKELVGHHLKMMLVHNSFGAYGKTCEATLYNDGYQSDTRDRLAPGFSFDNRTAYWLASNKYLGVTLNNGLYTCDAVGCLAVPPEQLMAALRENPEHLEHLGSSLGLDGYEPLPTTEPEVEEEEEEAPIVP